MKKRSTIRGRIGVTANGHLHVKKVLDNISWLFFDRLIRMGIGLFVGVWFARYLGPEHFGLLTYCLSFFTLFETFSVLGLRGIVVREISKNPVSSPEILCTAFILRVFAGIVIFAMMMTAASLMQFRTGYIPVILSLLGMTLVFKASEVIKYWYESQVESRYTIWIENAIFIVAAAVKIFLILHHAPLIVFVWLIWAEALILALSLLGIYIGLEGFLKKWRFRLSRAAELLKNSWPLIITNISVIVYMKIDQIMIGNILGNQSVGIYGAATKISELWYFIPVAINESVRPLFYKLQLKSEALFLSKLQSLLTVMFWMAVCISILLSIYSDTLIYLLFGDEYHLSASVLRIHIWAGIFVFLNNTVWAWYLAKNRQQLANYRIIMGMVLNITLNYWWIPRYGVVGAAWATLVARFFVAYIGQLFNRETAVLFVMMNKTIWLGSILNVWKEIISSIQKNTKP